MGSRILLVLVFLLPLNTFGILHFLNREAKLRPLVLIHGVITDYHDFDEFQEIAEREVPGIQIFALDAYNNHSSMVDLHVQVPHWAKLVKGVTDQYGEITLIGHSQGGVIAKAVVEYDSNPRIHTLITLSSPLAGQYGVPDWETFDVLSTDGKIFAQSQLYRLCYKTLGQFFSICQYWRDPTERKKYLLKNEFLPMYNNEVEHDDSHRFKENFLELRKLVLVGGPQDEVIVPWQSAQFGYFDGSFRVHPYHDMPVYLNDTFGLKTMEESGRLELCTMEGVIHGDWIRSSEVFRKCVKPYLYYEQRL